MNIFYSIFTKKYILLGVVVITIIASFLLLQRRVIDKTFVKDVVIESSSDKASYLDGVIMDNLDTIVASKTLTLSLSQAEREFNVKNNYWIDKIDVKQGDFYKFTKWAKEQDFQDKPFFFAETMPKDWEFESSSVNHSLSGDKNVAANGVSFYDAYAYCKAAGGALPTDEEWLAAAGGKKSSLYPWGDEYLSVFWPFQDAYLNATIIGGSLKKGYTPTGIADMGALVSEWTLGAYPQARPKIFGGNGYQKPYEVYSLTRINQEAPVLYRSNFVGFRCVYKFKPEDKTLWDTDYDLIEIEAGEYLLNSQKGSRLLPLISNLGSLDSDTIQKILNSTQNPQDKTISVSKYEVSVGEYKKFLNDPVIKTRIYSNKAEPLDYDYTPERWSEQLENLDDPVRFVSWWDAYTYGNWMGGRLPTTYEWYKIAEKTPESSQTVTKDNEYSKVKSVYFSFDNQTGYKTLNYQEKLSDYEEKDSKIFNLYGNVSEWTSSADLSGANLRFIVKGASFLLDKDSAPSFSRRVNPHYKGSDIGIRIVFDK